MGTSTLQTAYLNGQIIDASHINEVTQAIIGTFIGRDSGGAAVAGNSLGSVDYPWGDIWGTLLKVDKMAEVDLVGNFFSSITVDNTTVGANQDLIHPGTMIIRLIGAVTSIRTITLPVKGKWAILVNDTGAVCTLRRHLGAAGSQIDTGSDEDLEMAVGAVAICFYEDSSSYWRVVGGGGGSGGGKKVQGTRGAPVSIGAAGFTFTGSQDKLLVFAKGDVAAGTRNLSAVTNSISAGTKIGQEIIFYFVSATDLVQFANFGILILLGDYLSDLNNKLHVFWDGTKWCELGR